MQLTLIPAYIGLYNVLCISIYTVALYKLFNYSIHISSENGFFWHFMCLKLSLLWGESATDMNILYWNVLISLYMLTLA